MTVRSYEYRHVVGFEETNLLGNVYFVHHLRWHGHCREMFLRDEAPGVVGRFAEGLTLVTLHVSCDYLAELAAFDEICVRMKLVELVQNRMRLGFETVLVRGGAEIIAARGEQEIACMRHQGDRIVPAPLPPELDDALRRYS